MNGNYGDMEFVDNVAIFTLSLREQVSSRSSGGNCLHGGKRAEMKAIPHENRRMQEQSLVEKQQL